MAAGPPWCAVPAFLCRPLHLGCPPRLRSLPITRVFSEPGEQLHERQPGFRHIVISPVSIHPSHGPQSSVILFVSVRQDCDNIGGGIPGSATMQLR